MVSGRSPFCQLQLNKKSQNCWICFQVKQQIRKQKGTTPTTLQSLRECRERMEVVESAHGCNGANTKHNPTPPACTARRDRVLPRIISRSKERRNMVLMKKRPAWPTLILSTRAMNRMNCCRMLLDSSQWTQSSACSHVSSLGGLEDVRTYQERDRSQSYHSRGHDNHKEGRATKRRRRDDPSSQAPMANA